jgi:uncharacterized protein
VLEAPFTRLADVAAYHYPFVPVSPLLQDRFESVAWIGKVRAPILVLHGERDAIVPIRFGRALFAAAPEPKEAWFSAQGAHEDLGHYGGLEATFDFLARRLGRSPP